MNRDIFATYEMTAFGIMVVFTGSVLVFLSILLFSRFDMGADFSWIFDVFLFTWGLILVVMGLLLFIIPICRCVSTHEDIIEQQIDLLEVSASDTSDSGE